MGPNRRNLRIVDQHSIFCALNFAQSTACKCSTETFQCWGKDNHPLRKLGTNIEYQSLVLVSQLYVSLCTTYVYPLERQQIVDGFLHIWIFSVLWSNWWKPQTNNKHPRITPSITTTETNFTLLCYRCWWIIIQIHKRLHRVARYCPQCMCPYQFCCIWVRGSWYSCTRHKAVH